jgi:hypothetical protein
MSGELEKSFGQCNVYLIRTVEHLGTYTSVLP